MGLELIEQFYSSISNLWRVVPLHLKIKVANVIRKIINAGKNPDELQVNETETDNQKKTLSTTRTLATNHTSSTNKPLGSTRRSRNEIREEIVEPDLIRLPLLDVDYIMSRVRHSNALRNIVLEYCEAADKLDYLLPSPDQIPNNQKVDQQSVSPLPPSPFKSKEDELAFYGVPFKNSENFESDEVSLGGVSQGSDITKVPISPEEAATEAKMLYREYTQLLIDLCLDIVNHNNIECAALMFQFGLGNGILTLLQKDFEYDNRDKRLSYGVEILWYSLESFLEYIRIHDQSNGNLSGSGVNLSSTANLRSCENPNYTAMLEMYVDVIDMGLVTRTLKNLLLFQLNDGFRQSDKELRNEIMIVLTMFSQFPNAIGHFIATQLMTIFVTYASVEEIGRSKWMFFYKPVADSRNFATINDIDLEFKKQCWCVITYLLNTNDVDALLCFAASPFMTCLFQYLEYEPSASSGTAVLSSTNNQGAQLHGHSIASQNHPLLVNSAILMNSPSHSNSMMLSQYTPHDANQSSQHGQPLQHSTKGPTGASASSILLQMTQGKSGKGFIAQLTPSKLREFQLQAILCLLQNAPKVIGEFERMNGPLRIIHLALKLVQQYQLQGNASANMQGQQDYQMIVYYSLILLNRCLINSNLIRSFMETSQVIPIFLYIFIYSNHEESRAQAVRLIASLCSNNHTFCQHQVKVSNGIVSLLQPLKQYVVKRPALIGLKAGLKINKNIDGGEPIPDPYENPYNGEVSVLILAVLDALRYILVGNTGNELHFAEVEGLDILLDLLEISTFVLRLPVLRLLSDLVSSNAQLVTLINCWRSSKTLRSAAQILCHGWLDEESRLNADRNQDRGIICDLFHPLGNHHWPLADYEVPIVGFSNPSGENPHYYVGKDSVVLSQSVTVNKLTNAILASRNAIQTNIPAHICLRALESDSRILLADLLGNIGMFDTYKTLDEKNPFKNYNDLQFQQSQTTCSPGRRNSKKSRGSRSKLPLEHHDSHESFGHLEERPDEDEIEVDCDENGQNTTDEERTVPNINGTGFDDIKLSPREKQVLVLAKKYISLREGEWWRVVQQYVQDFNHVIPIEADMKLMTDRLDWSFDAAIAAQTEQMELYDEEEQIKKDDENHFIDQVLTKKHQQIKAEWLKRNAKGAPKKKR